MWVLWRLTMVLAAAMVVTSCGDDSGSRCSVGDNRACECSVGGTVSPGLQSCTDLGEFGPCVCDGVDAGPSSVDASMDAGDAAVDAPMTTDSGNMDAGPPCCTAGSVETRATPRCGEETRRCEACEWTDWERSAPDLEDPTCELGEAMPLDQCPEEGWLIRRRPCVACEWSEEPSECGGGCPGTRRTSPPDAEEICIPTRTFTRGCEDPELPCYPRHDVTVSAYYIDRYTVTVRRYQECVGAGVCSPLVPFTHPLYGEVEWNTRFDDLAFDDPGVPVWTASFEQATSFCAWDGADLVTGAQWEGAALGTHNEAFLPTWGTRDRPADYMGWCDGFQPHECRTMQRGTPRGGYRFDSSLEYPFGTIGIQNLYWFFEWTSDSLSPYAPLDPPERDPHISGPGHELRGGIFEAPVDLAARDIAARDATVSRTADRREWGDREHGSIRCARKAEGLR